MTEDIFKEMREIRGWGLVEAENIVINGEKEIVVIYHERFSGVLYQDRKWEEDVPQSVKDRVCRIITLGVEQYKEHEAQLMEEKRKQEEEKMKQEEEMKKQRHEAFAHFLYATEKYA